MFRKTILRERLKNFANQLIERYGIKEFYTSGQIEKTINESKTKKDIDYIYQLFHDPNGQPEEIRLEMKIKRTSLFKYLSLEATTYDIEHNKIEKILRLKGYDEVPGAHNPIGINSNAKFGRK